MEILLSLLLTSGKCNFFNFSYSDCLFFSACSPPPYCFPFNDPDSNVTLVSLFVMLLIRIISSRRKGFAMCGGNLHSCIFNVIVQLVNNYILSVKECCDILQNVFVLRVQVKPEIFSFFGNSIARLWFTH